MNDRGLPAQSPSNPRSPTPSDPRRTERTLTAALLVGVLACGAWVVWPHLGKDARAPVVTREAPSEVIPAPPAPIYPVTASVAPLVNGRVNLNTASREQLEALPRIGPALAERIEAGRPYRSLADLDAVRGVGPKLLEALAPRVAF